MHRPVEPSPFIVGRPVRAEEPIFGRADAFQFIAGELIKGSSVNIVGERRMGKTSLLNHLKHHLPHTTQLLVLARLDLQGEISNASRFYGTALRELLDDLLRSQLVVEQELAALHQRLQRTPEASYDDFHYVLRQLHSVGSGINPVLVLDEFERLLEPVTSDAFPYPNFFNGLRALITEELLVLIVASRSPLATYFSNSSQPNSLTSTFPNYLIPFTLQPLERDAADALLLQNNILTLSEATEAWNWAGGHPCHLQVAGKAYYEGKTSDDDYSLAQVRTRREELKGQSCMVVKSPAVEDNVPALEQPVGRPFLRTLGITAWTFPIKIGRPVQALGAKIDDIGAWLIGVALIILVVFLIFRVATASDVLNMLKQGVGLE